MRLRSALLAVFFALAWAPGAMAGEHALGFTVGGTSASGFTYRYFGDHGLGVQLTGFYVHATGSTFYACGAQGLWAIREVGWGRLYGVAGVGAYQGQSLIYGAGPGIEVGSTRGAALAIELPIAYFQGSVVPFPSLSYLFKF